MQFIAAMAGLVLTGVLVAVLLMDDTGRSAVLGAGVLALGTQIPAHLLLKGWRARNDRFVAAVAAGFAMRAAVLLVGGLLVALPGHLEAVPFLVALGGFIVGSVLAESLVELGRQRRRFSEARPR